MFDTDICHLCGLLTEQGRHRSLEETSGPALPSPPRSPTAFPGGPRSCKSHPPPAVRKHSTAAPPRVGVGSACSLSAYGHPVKIKCLIGKEGPSLPEAGPAEVANSVSLVSERTGRSPALLSATRKQTLQGAKSSWIYFCKQHCNQPKGAKKANFKKINIHLLSR